MIAIFFKNLLRDLIRQPLRTVLTLSGVIWGTFSVVLLIAFGDSLSKAQIKRFHGMGQGIVLAFPSRTTIPFRGFKKGKPIRLTPAMIEAISEKVSGIDLISPEFVQSKRIRFKRKEYRNTVRGINPQFELMRNTIPSRGRFINPEDMGERKRVAFIGNVLADDLIGKDRAVGKTIIIEGVPFTVIGVMKRKEQNSNYNGQRDEHCAFIPWTTFSALYGRKYVSNFIFRPVDLNGSAALTREIKNHLSQLIGFSPKDPDAIFIWDTMEFEKTFTVFFIAFTIFLGVIGSFTLLVGGVGVASIMMVVVEERTREIGIKLAVGARRRTILWQFFSESLIIMLTGGLIGFALSGLVIKIFQSMPEGDMAVFIGIPQMNPLVIVSTILILLAIGLISGMIPARTAASTNPIIALRK
jgi:putative ABC transport system permease protein